MNSHNHAKVLVTVTANPAHYEDAFDAGRRPCRDVDPAHEVITLPGAKSQMTIRVSYDYDGGCGRDYDHPGRKRSCRG